MTHFDVDEKCCICLDDTVQLGDCVRAHLSLCGKKLQCFIHESCLKDHIHVNMTLVCPLCRRLLSPTSIISLKEDVDSDYRELASQWILYSAFFQGFLPSFTTSFWWLNLLEVWFMNFYKNEEESYSMFFIIGGLLSSLVFYGGLNAILDNRQYVLCRKYSKFFGFSGKKPIKARILINPLYKERESVRTTVRTSRLSSENTLLLKISKWINDWVIIGWTTPILSLYNCAFFGISPLLSSTIVGFFSTFLVYFSQSRIETNNVLHILSY